MSIRTGPPAFAFCSGGATLVVLGALTWVTDSWFLRTFGLAAILVGGYVLLVGIGLLRVRAAVRRRADERALDDALLAAASGSADCASDGSCATCDTVCALRH